MCEASVIQSGAYTAPWAAIGSESLVGRGERDRIQKSGKNPIMENEHRAAKQGGVNYRTPGWGQRRNVV